MDLLNRLSSLVGKKISKEEPLSKHTSFKIGGPAKYFFVAENNEDLVRGIFFSKKFKIPVYLLGGGSNVLVSDNGFNGMVIVNKAKDIIFKDKGTVVADSGTNLAEVVKQTVAKGFGEFIWAAGIPGTVGGAVRGNAGAYRGETADNLIGVEVMRGSKQFILSKEQCKFGYRDSLFKHNKDIIISAEFSLTKIDNEAKDKINKILKERRQKQPLEYPSAGSIFRNVTIDESNRNEVEKLPNLPKEYLEYSKVPAAWLIENLDLKGKTIGGAQVSEKHANFIINKNKATASDVLQLISFIKMKVRDSYSLELMEEIEYVGF